MTSSSHKSFFVQNKITIYFFLPLAWDNSCPVGHSQTRPMGVLRQRWLQGLDTHAFVQVALSGLMADVCRDMRSSRWLTMIRRSCPVLLLARSTVYSCQSVQ